MRKLTFVLILAAIFVASCNTTPEIDYDVLVKTEYGDLKIKLYDETPKHKENFLKLANEGFFNDLLFHRVIKDFMIQGGDPESKNAKPDAMLGAGGPGYTLPAEFNPKFYHKKGALAAARQGDEMNPKKESSGSQFYIVQGKVYTAEEITSLEEQIAQGKKGNAVGNYIRNNPEMLAKFQAMQANAEFAKMDSVAAEIEAKLVAEMGEAAFKFALSDSIKKVYQTIGGTPFLDNEYTVFGEVVEGLNVIDSIAKVNANGASRPMKDIKMTVEVRKK